MPDILYVPPETGPYSVEGQEYEVQENGTIVVYNPEHVKPLLSVGASHSPFGVAAVTLADIPIGQKVVSENDPDVDVNELQERLVAVIKENEVMIMSCDILERVISEELGFDLLDDEDSISAAIRLLRSMAKDLEEVRSAVSDTEVLEKVDTAPGDTSESLDGASKIVDPGFTEDSDYRTVMAWLKEHKEDVPGNLSKAHALEEVAKLLKGE